MSKRRSFRALSAVVMAVVLCAAGCRGASTDPEFPEEDAGPRSEWKFGLLGQIGETHTRTHSDMYNETGHWRCATSGMRALANFRHPSGFEASAELGDYSTGTEEEVWKIKNHLIAADEMTISGRDVSLLAGWGQEAGDGIRWAVLGGFTRRIMDFDRDKPQGPTGDWESELNFATVEARASIEMPGRDWDMPPVILSTSLSGGWLLNPQAEMDGVGTIDGDYGWMARWRGGAEIPIIRPGFLYAGGFLERMDLKGGSKGLGEWPDSRLITAGLEFGIVFKF